MERRGGKERTRGGGEGGYGRGERGEVGVTASLVVGRIYAPAYKLLERYNTNALLFTKCAIIVHCIRKIQMHLYL